MYLPTPPPNTVACELRYDVSQLRFNDPMMLEVRRGSVSTAVEVLQRAATSSTGVATSSSSIRRGPEGFACECDGTVRARFEALFALPAAPPAPFPRRVSGLLAIGGSVVDWLLQEKLAVVASSDRHELPRRLGKVEAVFRWGLRSSIAGRESRKPKDTDRQQPPLQPGSSSCGSSWPRARVFRTEFRRLAPQRLSFYHPFRRRLRGPVRLQPTASLGVTGPRCNGYATEGQD